MQQPEKLSGNTKLKETAADGDLPARPLTVTGSTFHVPMAICIASALINEVEYLFPRLRNN